MCNIVMECVIIYMNVLKYFVTYRVKAATYRISFMQFFAL